MAPNLPLSLNNSGDSAQVVSTATGKSSKLATRQSAGSALGETAETFKNVLSKAQSGKTQKNGNKSNATRPSVSANETKTDTPKANAQANKASEQDAPTPAPADKAKTDEQAVLQSIPQDIAPVAPEAPIAELLPVVLLGTTILPVAPSPEAGNTDIPAELQAIAPSVTDLTATLTTPLPASNVSTPLANLAAPAQFPQLQAVDSRKTETKPAQTELVETTETSIDSPLGLAMAAQSSLLSTQIPASSNQEKAAIPSETPIAIPSQVPSKQNELGQSIPTAMTDKTETPQAVAIERPLPDMDNAQDILTDVIPMAVLQQEASLNSPVAFSEAMASEMQNAGPAASIEQTNGNNKTNRSNNSTILGSTTANSKNNSAANKANDFLSSLKAGSTEAGLEDASLDKTLNETLEALNGSVTLNQELPNNGQTFGNVLANASSDIGTDTKTGETKLPTFLSNATDPMDQLTEGAVYGVKNGQRELIIRLNPDNLGEVRVSLISHAGGGLSAKLIASNPESNALLESQAQQLQASLEAKGVKLERLSIMTAGQAEATNLLAGTEASNQSRNADQSFSSPDQHQQQQDSMKQHGGQQNFQDNNNAFAQQMLGNNGNYQNHSRHNLYNPSGATATSQAGEASPTEATANPPTSETPTRRQPGQTSILA